MQKIIKFLTQNLALLIVFALLIVPALSFADSPTLTASKITATSVTLNSTGLSPNQSYRFEFMVPADILKSQIVADAMGDAATTFSQLSPNETYKVDLVAYDPVTGVETSSGAPILTFITSSPNIKGFATDIGGSSLNVTGGAIDVTGGAKLVTPTPTPTIAPTKSATSTPITSTPAPTTLTPSTSAPASTASTSTSVSSNNSPASPSGGLVPCDNSSGNKCDFTQLMNLINKVIHFILFDMVIPIAAIMFAYAGFLMITAGGEIASARTKAKSIFLNALIGLVIAAAAWLIISTVLHIVGYDGSWIGLKITS